MDRTAVFVDAGYLFKRGSVALAGEEIAQEYLSLDVPAVVKALNAVVKQQTSLPLLRIYWYDAVRSNNKLSNQQMELAASDNIKTRLGQMSGGRQKGVDSLIVTDLIELARNHAMADAVLVAGDGDLRIGVLLAQQFGVRVHLVGVHSEPNQNPSLLQEADTTVIWDKTIVETFLTCTKPPAPGSSLDETVASFVNSISPQELAALKAQLETNNKRIPSEIDRRLLGIGREHFSRKELEDAERDLLRTTFVRLVLA